MAILWIHLLLLPLVSPTLLNNLRNKNPPINTASLLSKILPPTIPNQTETTDVIDSITRATTSHDSITTLTKDLQDHEQQHMSSVKMLESHRLELENLKSILSNASKVLSVHLNAAQERERNSTSTNIAQQLETSMQSEVDKRVTEAMSALTIRLEDKMDRILNLAAKRLAETATDIAKNAIQSEVVVAMEKYMQPPYTPGMVKLVQQEVSIELDGRLESAVLKQVDNVTAGVVDGLSWKQTTGVNIIDIDATKMKDENNLQNGHPKEWSLQAANASRFQTLKAPTTSSTNQYKTNTLVPLHVERMDGYLIHPQTDPITGKPLFSYDMNSVQQIGPDQWGNIDPSYRKCGSGRHQSPIDVRTHISTSGLEQANVRYDPYLADIVLKYDPIGPLILRNKGHVIDIPVSDVQNVTNINNYNGEGTWTLTHGTREYTLETMAFHVAGEHTLDGKRPDMELHLVHTAKGGKVTGAARNVLTLVVPFFVAINNNDDDKSDNFLDLFWDDIPPAGEQQVLDQTSLNVVAALFPSPTGTTGNPTEVKVTSDAFYAYDGSSTSPPCKEDVKYILMKSNACVHRITSNQLKILSESMTEKINARPIQNNKWGTKSMSNYDNGDYLEVLTKAVYVPSQIVVEAAVTTENVANDEQDAPAATNVDVRATPPIPSEGQGGKADGEEVAAMSNEAASTIQEVASAQ